MTLEIKDMLSAASVAVWRTGSAKMVDRSLPSTSWPASPKRRLFTRVRVAPPASGMAGYSIEELEQILLHPMAEDGKEQTCFDGRRHAAALFFPSHVPAACRYFFRQNFSAGHQPTDRFSLREYQGDEPARRGSATWARTLLDQDSSSRPKSSSSRFSPFVARMPSLTRLKEAFNSTTWSRCGSTVPSMPHLVGSRTALLDAIRSASALQAEDAVRSAAPDSPGSDRSITSRTKHVWPMLDDPCDRLRCIAG